MDITPHVMMYCRVEALERLARSLGVPIPNVREPAEPAMNPEDSHFAVWMSTL